MAAQWRSLVHRSAFNLFLYFFCIINQSGALFEDQVGKFDWKQEYIGHVKDIYIPPGNRRIVTTTEQNVLASLHPRNGQIAWRYTHEQTSLGQLNALSGIDESVLIVSGEGKLLRNWDSNTGLLRAESTLPQLTAEPPVVSFYQLLPTTDELLVVSVTQDFFLLVACVNLTSGSELWSYKLPVAGRSLSCQFVAERLLVCIDNAQKVLYSLVTRLNEQLKATPVETLLGQDAPKDVAITPLPGLLRSHVQSFVLSWGQQKTLVTHSPEGLKTKTSFSEVESVDAIEIEAGTLVFTVVSKDRSGVLTATMLETGEPLPNLTVDLDLHWLHGRVAKMWIYSVQRKEGGWAYRALLLFEDHAIVLVQIPGKPVWQREEALASVLNVEMVDLPVSESDAKFEQEFRSGDANLASMFVKRLTTQLFQVESFIMDIIGGLTPSDLSVMDQRNERQLTRDEFNLHKLLVLVTSPGKIYGMDSMTGRIIWSRLISDMQPFDRYGNAQLLLFIQRTTAHFPHHPQCAIIGQHKVTGKGLLYVFNPITGQPLDSGAKNLDFRIAQASLLPQPDDNYMRGVMLLDTDTNLHFYPASTVEVAKSLANTIYLFTADVNQGLMTGYSLAHCFTNGLKATPTWTINLPHSSQVVTHVVSKRPIEHVHSQGRVMGDRSVMYKYLNPNLVAVLTEGTDNQQKGSFFNILLVDVVTGNIVFSAAHKRCRGPLNIVHSENWIVYSYHNEKARRTEIAVLELYEGKSQSNTTAFSSLNPPQTPMVERQSYIFPPGLTSMAVTITEKGITSKHLLFALPSGGILELPKSLLDPRRPLIATPEHREEGIYPYIPELPVPSENIINYNKSIQQVRGIYTAAAGLESTCLILACGVDLYFTRVTPSRTFDVLKDDFDHYLITAVLLALLLASYATKRLAARKALHQAWK